MAEATSKTPLDLLYLVANDTTMHIQLRMEAAKALLPYTAKKTAETLETVNRNFIVRDERLASLNDDELSQLFGLVAKLTDLGGDREGTDEAKV